VKPVSVSITSLPRAYARHWAAAGLALLGALVLQSAWPVVYSGDQQKSAWLLAPCVIAATGYLLATAWFHATATRRDRNNPGLPLGRLSRGLACDLILGCASGAALASGHTAALFRAGLWIVPPTLLAVCAASALAEVLALRDRRSQLASHQPLATSQLLRNRNELLRLSLAMTLTLFLLALH
jgi:hypothetical protein